MKRANGIMMNEPKRRILAVCVGALIATLALGSAYVVRELGYADEYGPHQIQVLTDATTQTAWRISFEIRDEDAGYECAGANLREENGAYYLTFVRTAVGESEAPDLPVIRSNSIPGEPYVEFPLPGSLVRNGGELELFIEGRGRSWSQGKHGFPPG